MKLKITQQGWAGFTGNYGTVEFVDGISTHPVSPIIAQRLAACIQMETVPETEGEVARNPSITQVLIDSMHKPADVNEAPPVMTTDAGVGTFEVGTDGRPYTRLELEAIAAAKGITGLRELAPEGVKATKLVDLIEKLLKVGVINPTTVPSKVGDDADKQPVEAPVSPAAEAAMKLMAPPSTPITETEQIEKFAADVKAAGETTDPAALDKAAADAVAEVNKATE